MIDNALTWETVQADLRAGAYGDWAKIRGDIAREHGDLYPEDGLTSSDISHIAFGKVETGRLTRRPPVDPSQPDAISVAPYIWR